MSSHRAPPPVEEVVVDGVNGQLVDFFDVDAWSEALIVALGQPWLALPRAGRQPAKRLSRITT